MPIPPSSLDFLSCSPLLPDILSLLDHRSMLTCKLVNRRINHVIHNNPSRMPRSDGGLTLMMYAVEDGRHYFLIKLILSQKEVNLLLHGQRILLYNFRPNRTRKTDLIRPPSSSFGRYIADNVPLSSNTGPEADDVMLKRLQTAIALGVYEQDEFECLEYKSEGTEHSLRILLQFMLNKHNMSYMTLHNNVPSFSGNIVEPYIYLICRMFQHHQLKCENLSLSGISTPCIDQLHSNVAVSHTSSVEIDICSQAMLDEYLSGVKGWSGNHKVMVHPISFHSLETLVQLIQRWSLGETDVPTSLQFTTRSKTSYQWSNDEFVSEFEHIEGFRIKNKKKRAKTVIIGRGDGKFLTLKYRHALISIESRSRTNK